MFLPLIITIFTAMTSVTTPERAQFEMMPLPYSYDALSPAISSETIEYHYGKHYRAYLDKLNELIADTPFEGLTLEQIIQASEGPVFNNAAQVWNHTFYWNCMTHEVDTMPPVILMKAIEENFGSFENFKQLFIKQAATLFGSGWLWLVREKDGKLSLLQTSNADTPIAHNLTPLLTCDVWEHAYYLDQQNQRLAYINEFWRVINWRFVETKLTES